MINKTGSLFLRCSPHKEQNGNALQEERGILKKKIKRNEL